MAPARWCYPPLRETSLRVPLAHNEVCILPMETNRPSSILGTTCFLGTYPLHLARQFSEVILEAFGITSPQFGLEMCSRSSWNSEVRREDQPVGVGYPTAATMWARVEAFCFSSSGTMLSFSLCWVDFIILNEVNYDFKECLGYSLPYNLWYVVSWTINQHGRQSGHTTCVHPCPRLTNL